MESTPKPKRHIEAREMPYDPSKDYRLILNAHARRNGKFVGMLQKIDRLHPGAYAMTFVQPEHGYQKANFTQRLSGFENTPAYSQFLSEMDAYANRGMISIENRRENVSETAVEILETNRNGKTTRDSLRSFLSTLLQHPQYNPEWKSSALTMDLIKEEIKKLASKQECIMHSLEMWNLVFCGNPNRFKSIADLKLVIRILDALARDRGEPVLPSHPLESSQAISIMEPIESILPNMTEEFDADAILSEIMDKFPEQEDSERWDPKMLQYLNILSSQSELSSALHEWMKCFQTLRASHEWYRIELICIVNPLLIHFLSMSKCLHLIPQWI